MRRKRKTTVGTTKRRKTRANRSNRKIIGSGNALAQRKLTRKLRQAKLAERRATMKVGALTRKNKVTLDKMRRANNLKIASKTKLAAKARTQLTKKHSQEIRKLRREHAVAMKKMRKLLSRANKKSTGKGFFTQRKRVNRARKIGLHKRKTGLHKRKIQGRNTTAVRRRRVSRANMRRAA